VTSKFISTFTNFVSANANALFPAKPYPPLPTCSQGSQIPSYQLALSEARLLEVRVSMSEQWDQACQSCGREVRSKASSQLIANPDSLQLVKPYPLLPAGTQRSQIYSYQRSQFHLYWQSRIQRNRFAPSEANFTPTSEAGSTTTILLPAKSDSQRGKSEHVRVVRPSMSELWEWSQIQSFMPAHSESRFSATSEAISTATSLLPAKPDPLPRAKPVSPLPVKPDPPYQRSQIHPYQWSRIHPYQLAPSEVRLSDR